MSDTANPYDELARMWTRAMTGFLPEGKGGGEDEGKGEPGGAPDPAELMKRITDAHLAAVASGFRYLQRWAELSGRAYPLAIRALGGKGSGGGEELGAALDELRKTLREMAELPLQESRRLQADLAGVWKMQAPEPAPGEDEPPQRRQRRARVKE
ncbi:MAG TPA: hypothetical protein VE173_13220 [Longimicrobiales bacterium]|nr:hypothetical protein [Longimicrobiales bacterium]